MEKLTKTMMVVLTATILLMPVASIAGSLEPSAAPAPTMKTLDQIPPTWSMKLPAADRFVNLPDFNIPDMGAVLDKETGLVWTKNANIWRIGYSWYYAISTCRQFDFSGRRGWRLPTYEELSSLVEPFINLPRLPSGHPFYNVQGSYWSSTTDEVDSANAWVVNMDSSSQSIYGKNSNLNVWCVRGGQ